MTSLQKRLQEVMQRITQDNQINTKLQSANEIFDAFANTYSFDISEIRHFEPIGLTGDHIHIDGGQAIVAAQSQYTVGIIRIAKVQVTQSLQFPAKIQEYIILMLQTKSGVKVCDEQCNVLNTFTTFSLEEALSKQRRLYELEMILHEASHGSNKLLVVDGLLQSNFKQEEILLEKILQAVKENNHVVIGLAKSFVLCDQEGSQIVSSLEKVSQKKRAILLLKQKASKSNQIGVVLLKLHPDSEYWFRMDYSVIQGLDPIRIGQQLSMYSDDSVFLGYPYALIKADLLARVSNVQSSRYSFVTYSSSDTGIKKSAHAMLDSIQF